MASFTSFTRVESPMTLLEAKAIQEKTHLFGYEPEIVSCSSHHHIIVQQPSDTDVVKNLLKAMRSKNPP